jgi:hypothetical protein
MFKNGSFVDIALHLLIFVVPKNIKVEKLCNKPLITFEKVTGKD